MEYRGVMTMREQIRYDHGPSLKLPFNPRTSDIAGRTMTIVEVPVTANTLHIKTISAYHFPVPLSGISLGDIQRVKNEPLVLSFPLVIMRLFMFIELVFVVWIQLLIILVRNDEHGCAFLNVEVVEVLPVILELFVYGDLKVVFKLIRDNEELNIVDDLIESIFSLMSIYYTVFLDNVIVQIMLSDNVHIIS